MPRALAPLALALALVGCATTGATHSSAFVAPWLLGQWTGGLTITAVDAHTARLDYVGGNSYLERVVVVDDVIEFHGTFSGAPSLMKWRRLDDRSAHYFYHHFEGREWPADATVHKL